MTEPKSEVTQSKTETPEVKSETPESKRETLLYVGAFCDFSFPIFNVNILIDMEPEYKYFTKPQNGAYAADNLLATLQNLAVHALPGCEFKDVPEKKLWMWTHNKLDVKILYYHGIRYGTDELPEEVKETTVLHVCGYVPENVWKQLPKLNYITGENVPEVLEMYPDANHMVTNAEKLKPICDNRLRELELDHRQSILYGMWRSKVKYKHAQKKWFKNYESDEDEDECEQVEKNSNKKKRKVDDSNGD